MAALKPEVILHGPGFDITNTVVATLVTDIILVLLVILIAKNIKKIPGLFQIVIESTIEYFYNLTAQISGKNTDKIFPWFMSFFIVIFISNLVGLLPGFGSVGFFEQSADAQHDTPIVEEHAEEVLQEEEEIVINTIDEHGNVIAPNQAEDHTASPAAPVHEDGEEAHEEGGHGGFVPLFRGATSDFNVTFALAAISLIATHTIAFRTVGWKDYLSRYISLNPILLFVGILELVSEGTKLFSLSFRLFGNIYAGEVVLMTISDLFAFVAPIPFLLLELIVALVQALVFSMLTMVFMAILATPHGEGGDH